MPWPCFWVEDTGEVELTLRRYADGPCGDRSYHNAVAPIGRAAAARSEEGYLEALPVEAYAGDERWPPVCSCSRPFTDEDPWQVNQRPIYRARDGREWVDDKLPPGAMFDALWSRPWGVGADGIALTVVLPPDSEDSRSHWWHVDGPARGEGQEPKPNAWTRTGDPKAEPPTVDANPSILTNDYHGYLRVVDGRSVLIDPI